MVKRCVFSILLCVFPPLFSAGCNDSFGKVDQGRVIEFDKEKRVVTLIRDVANDPRNPEYTYLPPATYELPKDPREMGDEPKAGYCMKLDTREKRIIIFDPASKGFRTIDYKLIDQKERIERDDPLILDKTLGKPKKFPVVDKDRKTITIYSDRQKMLITVAVADQYLALPDKTWDAGDEVRVYCKKEGKALRFMNISKTDIFKK